MKHFQTLVKSFSFTGRGFRGNGTIVCCQTCSAFYLSAAQTPDQENLKQTYRLIGGSIRQPSCLCTCLKIYTILPHIECFFFFKSQNVSSQSKHDRIRQVRCSYDSPISCIATQIFQDWFSANRHQEWSCEFSFTQEMLNIDCSSVSLEFEMFSNSVAGQTK